MTPTSDPDNLRTRIAAVIGEHVEDQLTNYDAGRNECGCGHQGDDTYQQHLADAVIRELGLRLQKGSFNDNGYHGGGPNYPIIMRRYATEWQTTGE